MSLSNEKNLVKAAKNGNAEAFGELYALYAKDLYRFAFYYLGSATAASDAVQDAVLLAFRKIGSLKKADSFKTWLFKILRNCCAEGQKEKAFSARLVPLESLTEASDGGDPLLRLELSRALLELSDSERDAVLLSFVSGYTSREIAKMTGEKEGTVRSRISRACQKMRNYIGREG